VPEAPVLKPPIFLFSEHWHNFFYISLCIKLWCLAVIYSFETSVRLLQIKYRSFLFLETQTYLSVYFWWKNIHSESTLHFQVMSLFSLSYHCYSADQPSVFRAHGVSSLTPFVVILFHTKEFSACSPCHFCSKVTKSGLLLKNITEILIMYLETVMNFKLFITHQSKYIHFKKLFTTHLYTGLTSTCPQLSTNELLASIISLNPINNK
jgi:hypothetical protein